MLVLISTTVLLATWWLRVVFYNDMFWLCSAVDKLGGIDESSTHLQVGNRTTTD